MFSPNFGGMLQLLLLLLMLMESTVDARQAHTALIVYEIKRHKGWHPESMCECQN
jgi:hypothetical protein